MKNESTTAIVGTILIAINAIAFAYFVHVDAKLTARSDQLYSELMRQNTEIANLLKERK